MYQKCELLKFPMYQKHQFTCTKINKFYNQLKVTYMYLFFVHVSNYIAGTVSNVYLKNVHSVQFDGSFKQLIFERIR
jgi:hypothetical protein